MMEITVCGDVDIMTGDIDEIREDALRLLEADSELSLLVKPDDEELEYDDELRRFLRDHGGLSLAHRERLADLDNESSKEFLERIGWEGF